MSIIERATKGLAGVESEPIEDQQPDLEFRGPGRLKTIERAVNDTAGREVLVEELGVSAHPAPDGHEKSLQTNEERSRAHIVGKAPSAFRSDRKGADLANKRSRICVIDREGLHARGMVRPDGARTPVGECIRLIKSQLLLNVTRDKPRHPANVIMVTSSQPGEGKTFCAANLAISLAQERDRRVLLVDADAANPSIPEVLGIPNAERGLMDVLDQQTDLAEVVLATDIDKLSILSAGKEHRNAPELLASDVMRTLTRQLAEEYEDRIVIFDSPPMLAASEAKVLAEHAGQIVVVVEAGKTSERVLTEAIGRLDVSRVAGLVLNKAPTSRRKYGYGYGKSG
jgi:receptor protein-tyrosine kinase